MEYHFISGKIYSFEVCVAWYLNNCTSFLSRKLKWHIFCHIINFNLYLLLFLSSFIHSRIGSSFSIIHLRISSTFGSFSGEIITVAFFSIYHSFFSLLLSHLDRTINVAILWIMAKMAAPPLNRNSCGLRQPHPYQRLPHMHWLPWPPSSIKAMPGPESVLHHLSPASLAVWACH
jgi:hypothetical protein